MNKDQILTGLYNYLDQSLPDAALSLIIQNDIRVENFFSIHTGVYLDALLVANEIQSYSFQHTILLNNPLRAHIDIVFTDPNNEVTYLELKHFSISQNRGQGRSLRFYTSNSVNGKKVGIIGDCEKLDTLRNNGFIVNGINFVCCAFITHKPTLAHLTQMWGRMMIYPELAGWNLIYPVPYLQQNENLGFFTMQK